MDNKIKILLLTNRDSDNIGDQVIEASDIALLHAVMSNLEISKHQYEINSRAASIVSKKYMLTKDPELLKEAESEIASADLVLFGGAPVFNYGYQNFYERTAVTLELARKYNKPVIFSAVGVEAYNEKSAKCQRLKETLNFECVKQITTRDGLERLENYKENEQLTIGLVSDPAVFSATVFQPYMRKDTKIVTKKKFGIIPVKIEQPVKKPEKKKIGIFVLRANGFTDNKVDFTREDAAQLWTDLIAELKARGYSYELITSGHFGDEAFLDYLIRYYNIPQSKCVFNMNMPETLMKKMSEYDGVISCRLHPSIISFSMNIPAVSLVWNTKVTGFYNGIGYPDRAIYREDFTAPAIVDRLELAMSQGIDKDENYLISVYQALFNGIRNVLFPEKREVEAYSYDALIQAIPVYKGTSKDEQGRKLSRKFRRVYDLCNRRLDQNTLLKEEILELKEEIRTLKH